MVHIKKSLYGIISIVDLLFGKLKLNLPGQKPYLLSLMFHNLFQNKEQIQANIIDPQQGLTIDQFKSIIDYFLSRNFVFINHNDLHKGLRPDRNAIMITFDDGYFSNSNVLQVLEEFNVPATFFIATGNVLEKKGYWWDIVYRERKKQSASNIQIQSEQMELKKLNHFEIENYLIKIFGKKCLKPVSDIDRPFTERELYNFSKHRLVHLGNHTVHHAILTNYPIDKARTQIKQCQKDLKSITGIGPEIISYPNGNYSDEIITICREEGLKAGITVEPRKNFLPISCKGNDLMTLGRYTIFGTSKIANQCVVIDSEVSFLKIINRILGR